MKSEAAGSLSYLGDSYLHICMMNGKTTKKYNARTSPLYQRVDGLASGSGVLVAGAVFVWPIPRGPDSPCSWKVRRGIVRQETEFISQSLESRVV